MPTTLLAVDTATEVCSVALALDDQLYECSEAVGQKHSERVLPMVQQLLQSRQRRLADCDAIAFGAGPGAFTGLRIACGIAQGLAYGAGKPVVAVGNLEALAAAAGRAHPQARRIFAAIDARMQEIYWAVYAVDGETLEEVVAPSLAAAGDLPGLRRRHAADLVAGGALAAFPQVAAVLDCATAPHARASAASIAMLARTKYASGRTLAAALAAPIYVRDQVALTIDARRAMAGT